MEIFLNKQYEKYLFTYNKTNHIFDTQTYTNSMSSVIYNGDSFTVNNPIFCFDPTNSDGYFKVKTTQGHCYFQSPTIEQTVADTNTTLLNLKNELPSADSTVQIKQQTLISDFNYIFTQSNTSDKITVEMKANMNKNTVASTKTPIKYEMERDSGGTVTTDLLTLAGDVQFTGNILNNVLLKRAGTAIFDVNNSLTTSVDKQSILRMTNNEARLDQNFYQYNANDSIEFNLSANMGRFGVNTSRIPLKYELQRNGSQVVTKDMITITSNFLPPVKSNALSRSGLQTLNMGTSTRGAVRAVSSVEGSQQDDLLDSCAQPDDHVGCACGTASLLTGALPSSHGRESYLGLSCAGSGNQGERRESPVSATGCVGASEAPAGVTHGSAGAKAITAADVGDDGTGCILQLKHEDIRILEATDGCVPISVTFKRGKAVRLRGPYTVHTAVEQSLWTSILSPLVSEGVGFLFQCASPRARQTMGESLRQTLRSIDPSLEQRSIRRGALQHLSALGLDEAALLQFSGH